MNRGFRRKLGWRKGGFRAHHFSSSAARACDHRDRLRTPVRLLITGPLVLISAQETTFSDCTGSASRRLFSGFRAGLQSSLRPPVPAPVTSPAARLLRKVHLLRNSPAQRSLARARRLEFLLAGQRRAAALLPFRNCRPLSLSGCCLRVGRASLALCGLRNDSQFRAEFHVL